MIIAAERTLLGGRAEAGLGIAVDCHGVIERIAPLAALGAPTHLWPGELLVPGKVDVFAPELGSMARAVLAGALPSHALTGAMQRYRAYGTTTLGVPHNAPTAHRRTGHAKSVRHSDQFPEADLLIAAAQATDIRLALLDRIATDCLSLDDALAAFEGLVRHLMGYRDPRLSWALGAAPGPGLPMDALTGLRVRLGHLPCFIELAAGSVASTVHELDRLNLLDACTTIISPEPVNDEALATLLRQGASVGFEDSELGRALARAPGDVGHAYVLMTGPTKPVPHVPQRQAAELQTGAGTASPRVYVQATSTAGTRALGLQAGGFAKGAWADAYTLPLSGLYDKLGLDTGTHSLEVCLAQSAVQPDIGLQAHRCLVGGVATLAQH